MPNVVTTPVPAAPEAGAVARPAAARDWLRRTALVLVCLVVLVAAPMAVHTAQMMGRPAPPPDVGTVKASANGRYRVLLAAEPSPVPLQRLHRWTARVEPVARAAGDAPVTMTVDGGMPQHGHGLPTQPRVTGRLPDGRLVIDGMKFSMPGWWELRLYLTGPAGADSVTYNLTL